jgi:YidC/Oxa1 family membrane protein insertase
VILKNYLTTIAPESEPMALLSPRTTEQAYYVNKLWQSLDPSLEMPGSDTLWILASGETLTPQTPIVLRWESPQKISFERRLEIDEDYLLTITDRVTNKSGKAIRLQSRSQITRDGEPETSGYFILHEGPVGVFNGRLFESQYKDLRSGKTEEEQSVGGWVGITDKYWLTALIPHPDSPVHFVMQGGMSKSGQRYSVAMVSAPQEINEGVTLELAEHLFVGAKELQLLDRYAKDHKIARFDLAVDFGWFYVADGLHQARGFPPGEQILSLYGQDAPATTRTCAHQGYVSARSC